MTTPQIKRLKAVVAAGKHPMQQSLPKREKRAQKVARKIIELAQEGQK